MTKQETIDSIITECKRQGLTLNTQIAYVLATVHHETNNTFRPVREAYWLNDPDAYLKKHHPEYYPYYGRGYVQLTWLNNYQKYAILLEKDLVNNPDLALEHEIALFILCHGLRYGNFTGRALGDYISGKQTDYYNARRCVNGTDRAGEIASLARDYQSMLETATHSPEVIVPAFDNLEKQVIDWATNHGIFQLSKPKSLILKTISEVGKVCDNVLRDKDIQNDIGNIIFTLIVLCEMQKTTLNQCLQLALSEIQNRKGKMVNGAFVKETDGIGA